MEQETRMTITINNTRLQWDQICDVWEELDAEHVLAHQCPPGQRYLLDRLLSRMREMDRMYRLGQREEARRLAVVDNDDEYLKNLDSQDEEDGKAAQEAN
jgi:hypothetical protein